MAKSSVQFKIAASIIIVLFISIAFSIFITSENQRNDLMSATQQTLSINTEMLNGVIRNIMLSGEAGIATRTMDSLKSIPEFKSIDIFRTDGTIAFSDYSTIDFVNDFQDRIMFDKTDRIESTMIDNEFFKDVLLSNTPITNELVDTRELEYYFPILNYAECRVCHGDEEFIRGVSHFKVSIDNIYEKVNWARLILTIFFSIVGIIITVLLIFLMRKIVISKILTIGKAVNIVATGNLDVTIPLKTNDELGTLSDQLNNMFISLKEKQALELENKIIDASLKENRKYLDNIQEGLLLINKDMTISKQYSKYVVEMFNNEDIAGKPFADFLYERHKDNANDIEELDSFINILFTNTTAEMDMLSDINPLIDKWIIINENGEKMLVDAFFQRIEREGIIENVMVIFKDKTNIFMAAQELEAERERAQSEVDQIAALLKIGPKTFLDFIDEASNTLNDFRNNLSNLSDSAFVEKSFRNIHSLKGSARYLEFKRIGDLCHTLEEILAEIKKDGNEKTKKISINDLVGDIFNEFESVKKINERFKEFSESLGIDEIDKDKKQVAFFTDSMKRMVFGLAEELGKKVNIKFEIETSSIPYEKSIKSSIIHLLRNAVDHGVEEPFERIGAGKNEEANIIVRIIKKPNNTFLIEIEDDGSGLDFEKIKNKAINKNLLSESEENVSMKKLLGFLFMSGFSSKEDVSDISGRGVGLDAVKDDVKKLGGKISVHTGKNKGTRFSIILPEEKG